MTDTGTADCSLAWSAVDKGEILSSPARLLVALPVALPSSLPTIAASGPNIEPTACPPCPNTSSELPKPKNLPKSPRNAKLSS